MCNEPQGPHGQPPPSTVVCAHVDQQRSIPQEETRRDVPRLQEQAQGCVMDNPLVLGKGTPDGGAKVNIIIGDVKMTTPIQLIQLLEGTATELREEFKDMVTVTTLSQKVGNC